MQFKEVFGFYIFQFFTPSHNLYLKYYFVSYYAEASLGKLFMLPDSTLCFGHEAKEVEHKASEVRRAGGTIGSRMLGIGSKRNHTIGLGEREQLDLMVSESVIRWSSCTHLPTSLRSSLVC